MQLNIGLLAFTLLCSEPLTHHSYFIGLAHDMLRFVCSVESLTAGILRDPATLPNPTGLLLGWKSFDELYAVKPGVLTVIRGPAFSGKSEFATCLLQRLAKFNFPAAVCLLEGQVCTSFKLKVCCGCSSFI